MDEFDPYADDEREEKEKPVGKKKVTRTGKKMSSKHTLTGSRSSRSRSRSRNRSIGTTRSRSRESQSIGGGTRSRSRRSRSQNHSLVRPGRGYGVRRSRRIRSLMRNDPPVGVNNSDDDIDKFVLQTEEINHTEPEGDSKTCNPEFIFQDRYLSKSEISFITKNSKGLVKRFGGDWNYENLGFITSFELETHDEMNNFQFKLTDRLFRNISDIDRVGNIYLNQHIEECSHKIETTENFPKFKDSIIRFLKKSKKNTKQVSAIANYKLTEENSYGFALMVKAARAILNVAGGLSTDEYTCFCSFCEDNKLLMDKYSW